MRNPRHAAIIGVVSVLSLATGVLWNRSSGLADEAGPEKVVKAFDFEAGVDGWITLDPAATVEVATGAGQAKEGKGALAFTYTPTKGAFSVVGRQELQIAGARSMSFSIKTSQAAILIVTLKEKDESRYQTNFYSPGGTWASVSLDFSELTLTEDTTDENHQLDVDQVDGFGILDMEVVRAQGTDNPGKRSTLYLDEVRFLSTPVRSALDKGMLDDFENGMNWYPMHISLKAHEVGFDQDTRATLTEAPASVKSGKHALEFHYKVTPGSASVLSKRIAGGVLAEASALRFWERTSAATALIVALNERGGGRYNTTVYCPKDQYQQVCLKTSEFKLDDDSKDANNQLDLGEVASIDITDAAGFLATFTQERIDQERTLLLDGMEVVPKSNENAAGQEGKAVWSEDFRGGTILWIPVQVAFNPLAVKVFPEGSLSVVHPKERGDDSTALEYTYFVTGNTVAGLFRGIRPLKAGSARSMWLVARSESDTTLMVNLKERDESEYHHKVAMNKSDGWKVIGLPLSEFTLSEDKTDENNQLDLDQLKELALVDMSMGIGNPGKNTLWIESISLSAK